MEILAEKEGGGSAIAFFFVFFPNSKFAAAVCVQGDAGDEHVLEEETGGRIVRRVGPDGGAIAAGLSREDARGEAGSGLVVGCGRIVLARHRKLCHGPRRSEGLRVPVRPLQEAGAALGAEEREPLISKHPRA